MSLHLFNKFTDSLLCAWRCAESEPLLGLRSPAGASNSTNGRKPRQETRLSQESSGFEKGCEGARCFLDSGVVGGGGCDNGCGCGFEFVILVLVLVLVFGVGNGRYEIETKKELKNIKNIHLLYELNGLY